MQNLIAMKIVHIRKKGQPARSLYMPEVTSRLRSTPFLYLSDRIIKN